MNTILLFTLFTALNLNNSDSLSVKTDETKSYYVIKKEDVKMKNNIISKKFVANKLKK